VLQGWHRFTVWGADSPGCWFFPAVVTAGTLCKPTSAKGSGTGIIYTKQKITGFAEKVR